MTNAKAGSTREERDLHKINPIKRVIGSYISIITLNVNGLNAPTKRQRLLSLAKCHRLAGSHKAEPVWLLCKIILDGISSEGGWLRLAVSLLVFQTSI